LLVALTVGALYIYFNLYYPTYIVSVSGTEIGRVEQVDVFESAVRRVEAEVSQVLGYDYKLSVKPEYRFTRVLGDQYVSSASFDNYLYSLVTEIEKSYVLRVGGVTIGAASDKAALDAVLNNLLAAYSDADTTSASFVEGVSIDYEYAPVSLEHGGEAIYAALTANTNGQTTYTVVAGDTLSQIAYRNNMTLSELRALNPDVSADRLSIGQTLTVREEIPFLSVRTTKTSTYEEAVPFATEKVSDASMYSGDTKILTRGVNGVASVTANMVLVNGKEVVEQREVLSSTVGTEPTTQVVAVGTAPRPATAPKGYFIWPVSGTITSKFGYRTIFGSTTFHSGIDIANSYGTKIKASDGGTVTYVGTNGTYGKLIIISHGNGKQTYYAHLSSYLVSKGDKVYQGQVIAKMGQTGRATGVHLHFEIRINGKAVNPLSYLTR
jgi:murein DD-endopeptidase MepM/ murein hydrolase activator NlpD